MKKRYIILFTSLIFTSNASIIDTTQKTELVLRDFQNRVVRFTIFHELQKNARLVKISSGGMVESAPHDLEYVEE